MNCDSFFKNFFPHLETMFSVNTIVPKSSHFTKNRLLFVCFLVLSNQIYIITGHEKDKHGVPMGIKTRGCDDGEVLFGDKIKIFFSF